MRKPLGEGILYVHREKGDEMDETDYAELLFGAVFGVDDPEAEGTAGVIEHRQQDQPTHTVLMHRTFPTYTEAMWINAYGAVRLIVVTCLPALTVDGRTLRGVVREIPVGYRDMATAEAFRARFEKVVDCYLGMGWQRKEHEIR